MGKIEVKDGKLTVPDDSHTILFEALIYINVVLHMIEFWYYFSLYLCFYGRKMDGLQITTFSFFFFY